MKCIVVLVCLMIVVLGHKHHDTEVEDKWWETIVEFDSSEGGRDLLVSIFYSNILISC